MEKRQETAAQGLLRKVNVEGCKGYGNVYVSPMNGVTLGVPSGWHPLSNLPQGPHGDDDFVIRVRGRRWGGVLGQKVCSDCKTKGIK